MKPAFIFHSLRLSYSMAVIYFFYVYTDNYQSFVTATYVMSSSYLSSILTYALKMFLKYRLF